MRDISDSLSHSYGQTFSPFWSEKKVEKFWGMVQNEIECEARKTLKNDTLAARIGVDRAST